VWALTPSPSVAQKIASRLPVFEIDPPGSQAWKRRRLAELGFDIPSGYDSCRSISKLTDLGGNNSALADSMRISRR
jgi:hypothetical protein